MKIQFFFVKEILISNQSLSLNSPKVFGEIRVRLMVNEIQTELEIMIVFTFLSRRKVASEEKLSPAFKQVPGILISQCIC